MHDHSWYFTFAPGRWTAFCACGLAVAVEEPAPGKQSWEWTLHGTSPAADVMLGAIGSVTRARSALLETPA
ncbi:MAG TPA: hypothetical protein VIU62_13825 [Chloroflexota bacterium]|jgi:hypothetical protein